MEFEDQKSHAASRLAAIKQWVAMHRTRFIVIVGLVLITLVGLISYAVWTATKPDDVRSVHTISKPKPKYYSPLTGEEIKNPAAAKKAVTAIMIENSPDARPQSGLKEAEIVYEAVAEGGITRFLALYQQHKPTLIGPVRSVRLYYVDWVTPYNAGVAHVGGSAKALKLVRNGEYRDLDQFFNPGAYWRATDRYAPHNVYTNFKRLSALNKSKGYKSSKPKSFLRADVASASTLNAKRVNLTISSDLYNSRYVYSKKKGEYLRFEGGAKHMDREKGQISAKVVIALRVKMQTVFEDGYRESIQTKGSGSAVVFQNGTATKVKWRKATRSSQLSFSKNGKPFALARGTTWISAIPLDGGDVSWR